MVRSQFLYMSHMYEIKNPKIGEKKTLTSKNIFDNFFNHSKY